MEKVVDYRLADPAITPEDGARFRALDWAILRLAEPIDEITGILPLGRSGTQGARISAGWLAATSRIF